MADKRQSTGTPWRRSAHRGPIGEKGGAHAVSSAQRQS